MKPELCKIQYHAGAQSDAARDDVAAIAYSVDSFGVFLFCVLLRLQAEAVRSRSRVGSRAGNAGDSSLTTLSRG